MSTSLRRIFGAAAFLWACQLAVSLATSSPLAQVAPELDAHELLEPGGLLALEVLRVRLPLLASRLEVAGSLWFVGRLGLLIPSYLLYRAAGRKNPEGSLRRSLFSFAALAAMQWLCALVGVGVLGVLFVQLPESAARFSLLLGAGGCLALLGAVLVCWLDLSRLAVASGTPRLVPAMRSAAGALRARLCALAASRLCVTGLILASLSLVLWAAAAVPSASSGLALLAAGLAQTLLLGALVLRGLWLRWAAGALPKVRRALSGPSGTPERIDGSDDPSPDPGA